MKKSEIYKVAQAAVLNFGIPASTKLEVLRELMKAEDSSTYWEEHEEKEKANEQI